MLCPRSTAVASGQGYMIAATIFCRSWGCPVCAERRTAQLIAQAISGQATRFITLTSLRRPGLTPFEAAQKLVHAWQVATKRWKRLRPGNACEYLAVFEATKTGWPHLHILWRGPWLSQKWLSKTMDELANSPIVWIERIDDTGKAARYCAKYCGKEPGKFGTCKRYWSTKGWNLTPEDEDQKAFWEAQRYEQSEQPLKYYVEQWHIGLKANIHVGDGIAWWGNVPARRQGARTFEEAESEGRADHAGEARCPIIPRSRGQPVKPASGLLHKGSAPSGDRTGDLHKGSAAA